MLIYPQFANANAYYEAVAPAYVLFVFTLMRMRLLLRFLKVLPHNSNTGRAINHIWC